MQGNGGLVTPETPENKGLESTKETTAEISTENVFNINIEMYDPIKIKEFDFVDQILSIVLSLKKKIFSNKNE